ncbi:hypothetical protein E1B28_007052 [Marasmius oreades]|uniref:DUF6534 domain-containing protein n=1 Tax=Marasmius oreades TaxID=181124 RepID=A0A9P7S1J5_9AGAR|nr:uncharacterized protein E1B28_007052 [Marasmius oreades]KAG7093370.1 hypothetical protein E1B28_007052 [Marasmius oreades]
MADYSSDKLLGASLIGYAVSCVFLGAFLGQVVRYWNRYQDDTTFYKILVSVIGILELAHQAFISHTLYYYTILKSSDLMVLLNTKPPWTSIIQIMIGAIISMIVKMCFSLRVWRFSKQNKLATLIIVVFVLAEANTFVFTVFVIRLFKLQSLQFIWQMKTIGSLALGCGVAADVAIAAVLWYYLRKLKAGCQSATTVVTKISIYAVSTGAVTSAAGLATLLSFYLMPNFIFVAVFFVLSKLYGISFLAALNTRHILFPNENVVYNRDSEFQVSDSFTPIPPNTRRFSRVHRQSRSRWRERSMNLPNNSRTFVSLEPSIRFYPDNSTSALGSSDLACGSRFSVAST